MSLTRRWLRASLITACLAMQAAYMLLPLVTPRAAYAAGSWFVSSTNPAASDSPACGFTPAPPCRTIAYVLTLRPGVQSGDTVLLEGSFSENLVITRSVVLTGQGADITFINGSSSRVISVTAGVQITLDALTLRNGGGANGGGIWNAGALTMTHSAVTGSTGGFGGGLYNAAGATAVLADTTIADNQAVSDGGGMYNAGQLTGTRVNVSSNRTNGSGFGGGIFNSGVVALTHSSITTNRVDDSAGVGGGIHNTGSLSLTDTAVNANRGAYGAGINNESGGQVRLLRTVANDNVGSLGGALSNYDSGSVAVDESAFTGNIAPNAGGGIYNAGMLVITNTTFSGNRSAGSLGAGIDNESASAFASLTNASIISNTAVGTGLASGIRAGMGSRLELTNTIVAFNHGDNCFADGGAFVSLGNNMSNDAGCESLTQPSDLVNTDPKVGPLQLVTATYIHPLLRTSPAIDAIFSGPCPARDQRGATRPQNVRCDIGAVEAVSLDLGIVADASPQSVILGNGFAYVAEVINTGAIDATGVVVTGAVPAGVNVTDCAVSHGTCAVVAGQLNSALGNLAPGAKATVTLQVTPRVTGQIPMTFHVSGNEADGNAGNDSDPAQATVATDADLRITGSASPEVRVGQSFTLAVQVDNLGPGTAVNPVAAITLPANSTLVSANGTHWVCSATGGGVMCAWQPSLLAAGSAPVINIVALAPSSQQPTRVAASAAVAVSVASNDPNLANNQATAATTFLRGLTAFLSLLRKQ